MSATASRPLIDRRGASLERRGGKSDGRWCPMTPAVSHALPRSLARRPNAPSGPVKQTFRPAVSISEGRQHAPDHLSYSAHLLAISSEVGVAAIAPPISAALRIGGQ